jgi:hypothetical protein
VALSNSFSFSMTITDAVREAMLNIGALGESEVPTAQEFTDCQRKANMLVKQWMGKQDFAPGLKMWTRQRGDLFISSTQGVYQLGPTGDNWAGGCAALPNQNYGADQLIAVTNSGSAVLSVGVGSTGNYTVGDFIVVQVSTGDIFSSTIASFSTGAGTVTMSAVLPAGVTAATGANIWNFTIKGQRPLAILTAVLRDSNSNDIPLNVMTLEDYEYLPTKAMPTYLGDPTAWYYESQIGSDQYTPIISGGGRFYTDVGGAQDVTKHIHCVYLRPIMDLVNPGDNFEFPQQWYRPICWGLSKEICAMFDAEWTKDMEDSLMESLGMARQADPETTSLYFNPFDDQP